MATGQTGDVLPPQQVKTGLAGGPGLAARGWAALPAEYAIPPQPPSLAEARAYCERLVRTHYENFSVATWFLPARLKLHFAAVYAYCRISDDLGDEVGDQQVALRLLDLWESELNAAYMSRVEAPVLEVRGNVEKLTSQSPPQNDSGPRHPVFIALRETIRTCDIPRQPFADLLTAFRQDQFVNRYESFGDLLGYCRNSANPVGRLVLYVCGYQDEERQQLSDFTCTALQLANFWQDVGVDFDKGRIYLPLEDLRRFGVTEQQIAARKFTPEFRELMRFEVERAREWFERGLPLASTVDRELAIDIELFTHGGQEILNSIERQDFDVLSSRPVISKSRKLWLVMRAAADKMLRARGRA